jgi:hypothetical protein
VRKHINRRQFIQGMSAAVASFYLRPPRLRASTIAPTAPVAVAKCPAYGPEVGVTLATMLDQLGGLPRNSSFREL